MFEEQDLEKLKKLGVTDSKLLTIKKIHKLAKEIKEIAESYKIILVQPEEIDRAVNGGDGLNLNWLEAVKQAEIINELKPDKVVIDCPSPNITAFKKFLLRKLIHKPEIILDHKTELKFIEVAAASVIAKSCREEEVEKIEKLVGESIGSGYPSNLVCQKFLKENYNKYPEIIRKSWSTYKNLINNKKQKSLSDF